MCRTLLISFLVAASWVDGGLVAHAQLTGATRKTIAGADFSTEWIERAKEIAAIHEGPVVFRVRQIVRLDQIQSGTKKIRMWVSIPDDDAHQKILDMRVVSTPGNGQFVDDQDHKGKFFLVEVTEPTEPAIEAEVEFVVKRESVYTAMDPRTAGTLTDGSRSLFAEALRKDAPHMEVNPQVQQIADSVCLNESNLAIQATMIMDHIAQSVDHYSYSKDPNMPRCGVGDAKNCLVQGGGCCTDLNSLFIALARARGIPARLCMGYRLQEKNKDQLVDPGYRCWVEYFVPNYGWISADIVEADTPNGQGPVRWFTGLSPRRVWLNRGREFHFTDDQVVERVNHMSIAYAEIDGVPARLLPDGDLQPQITRKVQFTELRAEAVP